MFLKRVYKSLLIIAFFPLFLSIHPALATDPYDFSGEDVTADVVLYVEWKAALDVMRVVEVSSFYMPLIEEFRRLYNQSLVHRFQRLEDEPFDKVFPSGAVQSRFFELVERFNDMIEAVLDATKRHFITDERALLCMYSLNNLFLAKKPKTLNNRIGDLLKNVKRIAKKHPLLAAALSVSIAIVGIGGIYALGQKHEDDNGIDGTNERSMAAQLVGLEKYITDKKVVSQSARDCGYGAAYVTLQDLLGRKGLAKDQASYNIFLEKERAFMRKSRTNELEKSINLIQQHEVSMKAWLEGNAAFGNDTTRTRDKIIDFLNKSQLPQWNDLVSKYETVLKDMGYEKVRSANNIFTFHSKTPEETLSETDYITWLLNDKNRTVFRVLQKVSGREVALGGAVLEYIKTNVVRIAKDRLLQEDREYMNKHFKSDDLSAEEIEQVIIHFFGQQDNLLICGSPSDLMIDTVHHNKQKILLNEGVVEKIEKYRDGKQKQGVLINLGGSGDPRTDITKEAHWIGMIIDYKDGKPYAYTMDTLGHKRSNHQLVKEVLYLFKEAELLVKWIDDSLDGPLEMALRTVGLNKDVVVYDKSASLTGALYSVTRFIIFALYGKRKPHEPGKSYFEDNRPVFQDKCDTMKVVYKKIIDGIDHPEKIVVSIAKTATLKIDHLGSALQPSALLINSNDLNNPDFVHITCNLTQYETFEKFVAFIKQQPEIQGLIAGKETWYERSTVSPMTDRINVCDKGGLDN